MQNFLDNAGNGTIHLQAAEIREMAHDADNVLEIFALKIGSKRRPGFTNGIKRYACILEDGWMLHETRSSIEKIIERSNDLVRRLSAYCRKESWGGGEGPSSSTEFQEQRRKFSHNVDDEIAGRGDDIEKLVPVVVDEKSECRDVSICGMGGLGKTTLAIKIYKQSKIMGHFTRRDIIAEKILNSPSIIDPFTTPPAPSCSLCCFESVGVILGPRQRQRVGRWVYGSGEHTHCSDWSDWMGKLLLQTPLLCAQVMEVTGWRRYYCRLIGFVLRTGSEGLQSQLDFLDKEDGRRSDEELSKKLFNFLQENKCLVILDDIWKTETWDIIKPAFPIQRNSKTMILLTSRNEDMASGESYLHVFQCLDDVESWKLVRKIAFHQTDSSVKMLTKLIKAQRLIRLLVAEGIVPPKQQGEITEDVAEDYLMELAEGAWFNHEKGTLQP
ncbi:putative disease resistance protein At1g50180 [Hibiscus syriacus]|uniref:putative disease resistance protein At1g50180 n=1 Tax=Hibiscus syriacus TaxID=106335 RepID=UPI001922AC31|nr:putative disease resistance protein At1g50180 [Hibiscus syriacus]